MLDENLPSFVIKPSSSEDPSNSPIFLSENGLEPQLVYKLRKPEPSLPASKNCYAVALYDSYNLGILYAEVLVKPEWTQPTLSTAEVRAQNGTPPPIPVVPESFTIQLYNPDQQIKVCQKPGTWNNSAYWKFEMPVSSFRIPSSSLLDQTQNAPALSETTPKMTFKWKRDGKLSRDIACYMIGKNTDGKKRKEPDITVAFFKSGKGLTLYEPNLRRVEIEDQKGFEVILLLSAVVIKDIFFNPTREMFNIVSPKDTNSGSKLKPSEHEIHKINDSTSNVISNYDIQNNYLPSFKPTEATFTTGRPSKREVDQETERLKRIVLAEEKLRKEAEKEEERRIREMLKAEEEQRRRDEAEIEKETERLRRQYGTMSVENSDGMHANTTQEPRICKLTGKIFPTPLRVPPVVSGWLDAANRRDQKPISSSNHQSANINSNMNGLATAVKRVQKKKSHYL